MSNLIKFQISGIPTGKQPIIVCKTDSTKDTLVAGLRTAAISHTVLIKFMSIKTLLTKSIWRSKFFQRPSNHQLVHKQVIHDPPVVFL